MAPMLAAFPQTQLAPQDASPLQSEMPLNAKGLSVRLSPVEPSSPLGDLCPYCWDSSANHKQLPTHRTQWRPWGFCSKSHASASLPPAAPSGEEAMRAAPASPPHAENPTEHLRMRTKSPGPPELQPPPHRCPMSALAVAARPSLPAPRGFMKGVSGEFSSFTLCLYF